MKAKLAGDFEAAFDLMLFQLGRSVFTDGYKSHALDIAVRETADRPTMRMNDEDFAAWSPGEAMLEDRSGLSFDWLAIEDDGESFAAMRALSQAEKQALFAACVARTVKGQLAFEPLARPELEVTVARLDIDFASHVRPTADMLWSRINKGRILDIARSVLSPAWASDRSKNKKPDLAKAMEEAFAAGDPPLGLHADDHAAALAWLPPGFAAFDTGRVEDEPEDAAAAEPAAEASGPDPEPVAGPAADAESPETPADPPRTNSVVESVEAPAVAERRAAERAAANGNGSGNDHATPAAPETDSAAGDHGSDAGVDGPESGAAEPAKPADIAARHPGPVIGHDAGDGLDIPSSCAAYRGIPPSTDRTPRSFMRPAGPPSGGAFPFPHPSGRCLHEPHCQNAAGEDPRPHPRQRVEARHEDLRIDARRRADRDVAEFTPRRRHRGPHLRRHAYRPAWRRNAFHRHHRRRRHRHRRSRRPAELRREWLVRRPRPPRGRRRVRFREPVAPRLHGRLAAAFAGRPYLARLAGRSRPGTFPG